MTGVQEQGNIRERKAAVIMISSTNPNQDKTSCQRDEQFACFRDIRPGAPHHYLVVPRKHIANCKSLKKEHISTVEKMVNIGENVLQQNGIDDLTDVRLGFHWPPFCTINHLHLHVLAPASQMGFISRMVYRANSYWFITVDQLIKKLTSLPDN
ncbi:adenosine 5'-monophosphoramidase HINT3 isoform X2 [Mustelus asterias]